MLKRLSWKMLLAFLAFAALIGGIGFSSATPVLAGGECYSGSYISNDGGHNFVAFNTGKQNAFYANWEITKVPWIVQVAATIKRAPVKPWSGANAIGEVRAGFPWIDPLPWYYFFTPWNGFTVCKR